MGKAITAFVLNHQEKYLFDLDDLKQKLSNYRHHYKAGDSSGKLLLIPPGKTGGIMALKL